MRASAATMDKTQEPPTSWYRWVLPKERARSERDWEARFWASARAEASWKSVSAWREDSKVREKWSAVTMAVGGISLCFFSFHAEGDFGGTWADEEAKHTAKCTRARDEEGLQWHGEATKDWVANPGDIEAHGTQDQTDAATEGAAFEGFPGRKGRVSIDSIQF